MNKDNAMSATINSQTTLHQGRVFRLVGEKYTLANGVISDMDFIQHPGAAAMVPMLNQTEVVLIKHGRLYRDLFLFCLARRAGLQPAVLPPHTAFHLDSNRLRVA